MVCFIICPHAIIHHKNMFACFLWLYRIICDQLVIYIPPLLEHEGQYPDFVGKISRLLPIHKTFNCLGLVLLFYSNVAQQISRPAVYFTPFIYLKMCLKREASCSCSRGFIIFGCNRETVNALNIYLSRFAYNAIDKVLRV